MISASVKVLRSVARRWATSASSAAANSGAATQKSVTPHIAAQRLKAPGPESGFGARRSSCCRAQMPPRARIMARECSWRNGLRSAKYWQGRSGGQVRIYGLVVAGSRDAFICSARMRSARLPLASPPAGADLRSPLWRAPLGGRFARQHRLDRRVGAFERNGKPGDFRRDVVDALAQQRIFHPLGRPGLLGLALHGGDFLLQLGAIGFRLGELILDQRLFLDQALRCWCDRGRRHSQARRADRFRSCGRRRSCR